MTQAPTTDVAVEALPETKDPSAWFAFTRCLVQNARTPTLAIDLEGQVCTYSTSFEELWTTLGGGALEEAHLRDLGVPAALLEVVDSASWHRVVSAEQERGGQTIAWRIRAIHDPSGEARCFVVEAEQRHESSEEWEARFHELESTLHLAPNAIMIASDDLTIEYVNPKSLELFRKIAHEMPVAPEEVVGHSVDIFHKNSAHQQRLLSHRSNLPHSAQVQLGDEILEFNIDSGRDANGAPQGYVVFWSVITEEVRLREEIEAQQVRLTEQNEQMLADATTLLTIVERCAQGDLTVEEAKVDNEILADLSEGLEQFINSVRENMRTVLSHSEEMKAASGEFVELSKELEGSAQQTSEQALAVSAASEEVSTSVNTLAAAAEEMSMSIQEISTSTSDAARIAEEAVLAARDTNTTISQLGESSAEIGKVIKVITSIAQQTNLLALNATIEAARAGEAGKGFAVVANEVKELAKETANATEDISRKIEAIQQDTRKSVDAISSIGQIINQISDIQTTIATAISQQSETTNEIGRSVNEAAKASMEISENIAGVAMTAKRTAEIAQVSQAAAGEMGISIDQLKDCVNTYRLH